METIELLEAITGHQDPLQQCAGFPIIPQYNFEPLALVLTGFESVTYSVEDLVALFFEEAKRYTACGGNMNERFAVLRKPPASGWSKLVILVTEKQVSENPPIPIPPVVPEPLPVAALSITKVMSNSTPDVGETIVFTTTITNAGPSVATGVMMTDLLPSGYTYVSDNSLGVYIQATGMLNIGELAVGETISFHLTATVNATGEYSTTARVLGNETDPDLLDNTVTTTLVPVVIPPPEPELPPGTIGCDANYSESGGTGFYTLTIDFGLDTGECGIDFNAVSVPDRAKIIWDGVEVADSKFVGSESYYQQLLDKGYTDADMNLAAPGGNAYLRFNKTSSLPRTATITVDAPFGTYWTVSGVCVTP